MRALKVNLNLYLTLKEGETIEQATERLLSILSKQENKYISHSAIYYFGIMEDVY